MPTSGKTASRAVNETLDVRLATESALSMIQAALADGEVTVTEATRVMRQIETAYIESQEAVYVAQVTEFRQRLVVAGLNEEVSLNHLKEAEELGLDVMYLHPTVAEPVDLFEDDRPAA